ncbi:MAG: transketolase [bacterium]
MRTDLANSIINLKEDYLNMIFLTGDLGYMALEEVRVAFGSQFINAGIAEQNMITVAAGMAYEGFIPWVYSIAPFTVLRPYEQIRNDVCLHNLPVKIVGNGGGYGYGIMGCTHHVLEDIAVMRVLPNMRVYVPLIASDVEDVVRMMMNDPAPNYLRLNNSRKLSFPIDRFKQWRKIKEGKSIVIIGTGPTLLNLFDLQEKNLLDEIELWSVGLFPIHEIPEALLSSLENKKKLITIEEHEGQCGLNETIAQLLLGKISYPIKYHNLHANGYPSGRVGSQKWHQEENNLAGNGLIKAIKGMINENI